MSSVITLPHGWALGEVGVGSVWGESVAGDHRLVVGLRLHLHLRGRPQEQTLSVMHLRASLHCSHPVTQGDRMGPEVWIEKDSDAGWTTHPTGALHVIDARFHLTREMVQHLAAV